MLPWKRRKFALLAAEEERRPPVPSPVPSPAVAWPSGGARSLGRLFRRKRGTFRVSGGGGGEARPFSALYLGHAATLQARGEGCTEAAVGRIWARSEGGRRGARMRLSVGPQGLRLAPADGSAEGPAHLYLLHRLTFCVADPRLPRLFAWVYRHEARHKAELLRCHAVLLSRAEKARALALLLHQTSAAALAEFRRLKRRADARRQQLQQAGGALPLVPLRRLLLHGPAAAYKPPVERGRGAPRLGPITEDALGEEREARADGEQPVRERDPQQEEDGDEEDEDALLLPPLSLGLDGGDGLGQLIDGLGQLAIGNDLELLRADLRVTRLLSGDSTGSESSLESDGQDGSPPQLPDSDCA